IVGIEPEIFRHRPGAVHREHQELAVGEVDDAQHAEDQRQADAHERVDAADEQTGDDQLSDGCHRPRSRRDGNARAARQRGRASRQRWLQFGSGTMTGSVVASFFGNTWLLPVFCHCHTPIDARRFWPASFGSTGQSLLVNLMPLPFARLPSGRSSLSAMSRSSAGSYVLALGKTSVNSAQVAEKAEDACPAGGRFILSS